MNIEDIAIIRETLAEDDLEELTALDLEKRDFKSNVSGTGVSKSGISAANGNKNKKNLVKLIENMPQLEQIDEVRQPAPKTISKTGDLRKQKNKSGNVSTTNKKAPSSQQ